MAAIKPEVRAFIVQRLACFESPSIVAAAVKEEFGVEVSRMAIHRYDPTTVNGQDLAQKWRDLFNKVRAKFLDDTSSIPISHKAVRLSMLQRMTESAERSKNIVLAASLIEQAAKEVGESYTNKQKIDHTTGGEKLPAPSATTPDQMRDIVKSVMDEY